MDHDFEFHILKEDEKIECVKCGSKNTRTQKLKPLPYSEPLSLIFERFVIVCNDCKFGEMVECHIWEEENDIRN